MPSAHGFTGSYQLSGILQQMKKMLLYLIYLFVELQLKSPEQRNYAMATAKVSIWDNEHDKPKCVSGC
jgi:hypothetical protein